MCRDSLFWWIHCWGGGDVRLASLLPRPSPALTLPTLLPRCTGRVKWGCRHAVTHYRGDSILLLPFVPQEIITYSSILHCSIITFFCISVPAIHIHTRICSKRPVPPPPPTPRPAAGLMTWHPARTAPARPIFLF